MKQVDPDGHVKTTPGIPRGTICAFSGSAIPDGWLLCDGTDGFTPDLTDRFVLGNTVVDNGAAGGTQSVTTATYTHSGMAVAAHPAHVVTQPSAHSAHVITQPSAHSDHVVTQASDHATHSANVTHTHDSHTTAPLVAGTTVRIVTPTTHAANLSTHTHNAHSAHSGAALDAHSAHSATNLDAHSAHSGTALDAHSAHGVTQPSSHAVLKHMLLVYIMYVGPQ